MSPVEARIREAAERIYATIDGELAGVLRRFELAGVQVNAESVEQLRDAMNGLALALAWSIVAGDDMGRPFIRNTAFQVEQLAGIMFRSKGPL